MQKIVVLSLYSPGDKAPFLANVCGL